ncbi:MAG: hypothetical protein WCP96_07600 [Methylococcaceae bacterium]
MKLSNILLSVLLLPSFCLAENVVIDIKTISGKKEEQVSKFLGSSNCQKSEYGKTCYYEKSGSKIVYIKGVADWLTLRGMDNVAYGNNAISAIGLQESNPTFSNENVIRWENVGAYKEISVFPAGNKVFYIYVKTNTK